MSAGLAPLLEAVVHRCSRGLWAIGGAALPSCAKTSTRSSKKQAVVFQHRGDRSLFCQSTGSRCKRLPSLLHEVPKVLYGRKRDDRSSEFVDEEALADESFGSVSARPASGRSSDALPSTSKSQDRAIRSGEFQQASRSSDGVPLWTVDPRRSPGSGRTNLALCVRSPTSPIAWLVWSWVIAIDCCASLAQGPKREALYPKLYFQAELLSDGPGEKRSRDAGILRRSRRGCGVRSWSQASALVTDGKAKLAAFVDARRIQAEQKILLPMLSERNGAES